MPEEHLAFQASNFGEDEPTDMAQWVKCEYGKGVVDRAGEDLTRWWTDMKLDLTPPLLQALDVAQAWRACHAFPLNTFQTVLRQRARRIDQAAIVAQRLKRFSSMMNKLAREPKMKLSQMQDLGGCRAIMPDIDSVYRLLDSYGGQFLFDPPQGLRCRDYIHSPKLDGYRGIHVIGRYVSRRENTKAWNGQRIEIQLRSQLQHLFATAVETVTTFKHVPLKFGGGPQHWRRFFSLMGSAIAIREGTPLVEGTPSDKLELTEELKRTSRMVRVHQRLRGWAEALKVLPSQNIREYKWLLLVLDVKKNTIKVRGYADRKEAIAAVNEIELQKEKIPVDVVLVSVASIRELRLAYPNYYADTAEFLRLLDVALKS